MRVLQEGKVLVNNHIFGQTTLDGDTAYQKDKYLCAQCRKILSYAQSPKKLAKLPTKINPSIHGLVTATISIPRQLIRTKFITVDNVDSFKKIKKYRNSDLRSPKIHEKEFKAGIQRIIGERGKFNDWGGEKNDLFTTRLEINGKRMRAAFAFKGPGKSGRLTPKMMGKNGDQIQRLFESSAEIFFVQYWNQIDENIVKLMGELAKAKSVSEGRRIYYGIIDGHDSSRIMSAYQDAFLKRRKNKKSSKG